MSDSITQLGDPFSAAATQNTSPGFLGQSPAFWAHLAQFGGNLAAAANARTPSGHLAYGAGFAGPFGAAIGETAQQSLGQAVGSANIGRSQAETRHLNMENQALSYQLPLQQAQANALADYWKDPSFLKNLVSIAQGQGGANSTPNYYGGQAQTPSPPPTASPGSYAGTVNGPLEGGPGQNPRSSASGYGQLIDTNKQKFVAAHPEMFKGANTPELINAAFQKPEIGTAATNWLAQQNAPVLSQAGVQPTGANLAMAHRLGANAAIGVAKAPDDMPLGSALVQTIGLPQARSYIEANPEMGAQTVGGFKRQFAGVPDAFGGFAKSAQLGQQAAAQQALQALHFPMVGGDPNFTRTQAQDWWKLAAAPLQAGAESDARNQSDLRFKPQIAAATLPVDLAKEGFAQGPGGTQAAIPGGKADPNYHAAVAGAEAGAKFPYTMERVSPGGVLAVGGKPAFSVPQRSEEVLTSGPNKGTVGQVYRDPLTGEQTSTAGGGEGGMPPGFVPTQLSPQVHGGLAAMPKIAQNFIEHDNKMVDEDLAHVIENVTPAKQALFQLRALNPDANTGAQGEFRANFKNWVQEFAPDFVSQITGDASPAQEFKKIALMGAGKQERGDLGARGGFRAIEMYTNANPNLENTPTANHDMANALLISHQYHEDYAQGATSFFNNQVAQAQQKGSPEGYQKLSNYDKEFIGKMRPELYASAISAINGKPSTDWAKGLTPKQVQIIGGILQRTDPTAVVDMNGHQVPVNAFKTTFSPDDVMGGVKSGG
jgi:hypothetical protein